MRRTGAGSARTRAGVFRTKCYTADSVPTEEFMDANTVVKLVSGGLAVILVAVIILRRKKKKETEDEF